MLTNEQRAHDIAISLLPTMLTLPVSKTEIDENGNVPRDIMEIYLSLYCKSLETLNKEFK